MGMMDMFPILRSMPSNGRDKKENSIPTEQQSSTQGDSLNLSDRAVFNAEAHRHDADKVPGLSSHVKVVNRIERPLTITDVAFDERMNQMSMRSELVEDYSDQNPKVKQNLTRLMVHRTKNELVQFCEFGGLQPLFSLGHNNPYLTVNIRPNVHHETRHASDGIAVESFVFTPQLNKMDIYEFQDEELRKMNGVPSNTTWGKTQSIAGNWYDCLFPNAEVEVIEELENKSELNGESVKTDRIPQMISVDCSKNAPRSYHSPYPGQSNDSDSKSDLFIPEYIDFVDMLFQLDNDMTLLQLSKQLSSNGCVSMEMNEGQIKDAIRKYEGLHDSWNPKSYNIVPLQIHVLRETHNFPINFDKILTTKTNWLSRDSSGNKTSEDEEICWSMDRAVGNAASTGQSDVFRNNTKRLYNPILANDTSSCPLYPTIYKAKEVLNHYEASRWLNRDWNYIHAKVQTYVMATNPEMLEIKFPARTQAKNFAIIVWIVMEYWSELLQIFNANRSAYAKFDTDYRMFQPTNSHEVVTHIPLDVINEFLRMKKAAFPQDELCIKDDFKLMLFPVGIEKGIETIKAKAKISPTSPVKYTCVIRVVYTLFNHQTAVTKA
jgi:hypothetical protein